MAKTNVNIRMDAALKSDFEELCANLGLTMTAAFTIFARKAVSERRIPFELSLKPQPGSAAADAGPGGASLRDVGRMMEDLLGGGRD